MVLDLDECIERSLKCELLSESTIRILTAKAKEILIEEPNILNLSPPITVVGDVHGQFYDVLEMLAVAGEPPDTNFLFLGDYVDRGYYSTETLTLLTCLKIRYPDRIHLLRGNHETRQITQVYGFYLECERKFGNSNMWRCFMDMCDYLAIAALIDNRIFCVHGGLSPSVHTLDQIRVLERVQETPHEGALNDLMWSDPSKQMEGFGNNARGAGYAFGRGVVHRFLMLNKVDHILRAHQLCMDGFEVMFNETLSTIWSAPNYCYRLKNVAGVVEVDENLSMRFNVYDAAPASVRQVPKVEARGLWVEDWW